MGNVLRIDRMSLRDLSLRDLSLRDEKKQEKFGFEPEITVKNQSLYPIVGLYT